MANEQLKNEERNYLALQFNVTNRPTWRIYLDIWKKTIENLKRLNTIYTHSAACTFNAYFEVKLTAAKIYKICRKSTLNITVLIKQLHHKIPALHSQM